MAGTPEGARKARQKNLEKDPDFYAKIGARSWANPKRSRKTGFALLPKDKHKEVSSIGGSKTKKDYRQKEEYVTAEEIRQLGVSPDLSE